MELIDREALVDTIEAIHWYHVNEAGKLTSGANSELHTPLYKEEDIFKALEHAPTVDAVPVVHGRWLLEREPDGKPYCLHCSVCDGDFSNIGIMQGYDYCPNCGAKMDGGVEDADN